MSLRRRARPPIRANNSAKFRRCAPDCPTPRKIAFKKKAALGAAATWRARGQYRRAYRCPSGGSWHLSGQKTKRDS